MIIYDLKSHTQQFYRFTVNRSQYCRRIVSTCISMIGVTSEHHTQTADLIQYLSEIQARIRSCCAPSALACSGASICDLSLSMCMWVRTQEKRNASLLIRFPHWPQMTHPLSSPEFLSVGSIAAVISDKRSAQAGLKYSLLSLQKH